MKTIKTILALAAAAALSSTGADNAVAKTLFGCDFSDCTSPGVPSIGEGGTYAAGTGYGSTTTTGVTTTSRQLRFDTALETYIDKMYEGPTWAPDPCVTGGATLCLERVNVSGKRQPISSVWTLDPNSLQPNGGGLILRGGDYGQRQPDLDGLAPPNNTSKQRCIANCDMVQKLDTNWCNTVGAQFGGLTYLVAEGGAIWVGTTTGAAASTTTGPLGPVAGLATWAAARNAFIPVSKDLAAQYVATCTSFANGRWGDCMRDKCHA